MIRRYRRRLAEAKAIIRQAEQAERAGDVLIPVPRPLAAQIRGMVWHWKMERAAERWANGEHPATLTEWQAKMTSKRSGHE